MNPNWHADRDLSTEDADALEQLEELRCYDPIIWAITSGIMTSRSIAKLIHWPHDWVMIELKRLKKEGIVWDSEGRRSILWQLTDGGDQHLRGWVARQKLTGGIFNPLDRNENDD